MPTELWDLDNWPSPSPEAVVRARVAARTRAVAARRLAPVVAMMITAAMFAVVRGPGGEDSQRVRVTDQQTTTTLLQDVEPRPGPSGDGPGPGAGPAVDDAVAPPSGGPSKGVGDRVAAVAPAPPPVTVPPLPNRATRFADVLGDAVYQGVCGAPCPPEAGLDNPGNQRAADLTQLEVECREPHLRFTLQVNDLDAPLAPHYSGTPASSQSFSTQIDFWDWGGSWLWINHVRYFDGRAPSVRATYYDVEIDVRTTVEGDRLVWELPFEVLARVAESRGATPPGPGKHFMIYSRTGVDYGDLDTSYLDDVNYQEYQDTHMWEMCSDQYWGRASTP